VARLELTAEHNHVLIFNHLMDENNHGATLNNIKLVQWPLMGGL